jgi:aspartyl protease family protein
MVIDLGTTVDKAQADYKAFAADADIKNALATINQTSKLKMRLGPTTEFAGKVAFLQRYRKGVASDVIPITIEGNVATVDVTLNGTLTRSLVLDTGASLIALPAELAEQLKIVPGPADPTLHMTLADGRIVEAKLMILKSVRVGQFTAKDVECAVMPKTLVAAEALLGGSFLQNFIVKIDPQAKELHLSAIEDSAKKITSTAGPTTKPAKKP